MNSDNTSTKSRSVAVKVGSLLTHGFRPSSFATKVYVVRHGETDWNVQGLLQGHEDTPLNERGRRQARRVARHFAGATLHHVYSSDLIRALDTAREVVAAVPGCGLSTTPDLRERDFGPLTGRPTAEVARLRDAAVRNEADPTEWAGVPGVESDARLSERLWRFLRPLPERHAGQTVMLVTHGGVLRVLLYAVLHIPLDQPWRAFLANAAINLFEVHDGVWRMRTFGMELPEENPSDPIAGSTQGDCTQRKPT